MRKTSSDSSLLLQVQRHWQQSVTGGSLAATMAVSEDQHGQHTEEQGKVFQQNIPVMIHSLCEEVAPPSSGTCSVPSGTAVLHTEVGTSKDGGSVFAFCWAEAGRVTCIC